MAIHKRVIWVGTFLATWQFLGCSKISEQYEPTAQATGTVAYQTTHRKIYQNSVIPGGVYSSEELDRARRTDPIVATHYSDFGADARVARLNRDELVYVSYRKAAKVFWTQKKHRVCEGEAVIKDAKGNFARSRCGNRLSKTPKLPTAKTEPSEAALNAPAVEPLSGPALSGAGPGLDGNLPQAGTPAVGAFGGDPTNNPSSNQRSGTEGGSGAPVATGARSGAGDSGGLGGFFPSVAPYFGAGALAAPVLAATTPGSGTGTTGTTSNAGSNGGTTSTPAANTPETGSLGLFLVGCLAVGLVRVRKLYS